MPQAYDIVVVGGGLAGLSAAYHAALRGLEVACIQEGGMHGGLLVNVGSVDDLPGLTGAAGAAVADTMVTQCREAGVDFIEDTVGTIGGRAGQMKVTGNVATYGARRVIAASGARPRTLGVPGENELAHKGVSDCAWCDGGLYRGQRVAVVGAGDSAIQAALHLAGLCDQVDILVRGEALRARQSYVSRAADIEKIAFHWATSVESIEGADGVTGIAVREDDKVETLPCTGIFVYAGLVPNTGCLPDDARLDEGGAVITNAHLETSHAGLFAAGAVRSGYGGQGVNALADGATAAIAAAGQLLEE